MVIKIHLPRQFQIALNCKNIQVCRLYNHFVKAIHPCCVGYTCFIPDNRITTTLSCFELFWVVGWVVAIVALTGCNTKGNTNNWKITAEIRNNSCPTTPGNYKQKHKRNISTRKTPRPIVVIFAELAV